MGKILKERTQTLRSLWEELTVPHSGRFAFPWASPVLFSVARLNGRLWFCSSSDAAVRLPSNKESQLQIPKHTMPPPHTHITCVVRTRNRMKVGGYICRVFTPEQQARLGVSANGTNMLDVKRGGKKPDKVCWGPNPSAARTIVPATW
jgi:hypothetical protein